MMSNNSLLHLLKPLGLALVVLHSVGCVSLERLVKVPAQPELATVKSYNTELHRQSIHLFNPIPLDSRVAHLSLEPRVKNLFFLVDQSSVMSGQFRGVETRFYAREMVRRFAQTMPDQSYSGALLKYDQQPNPRRQELLVTNFTADDVEQALGSPGSMEQIESDSLATALDKVSELISRVEGSSAVILITSWSQIDKAVEHAVMRMRQRSSFEGGMGIVDSKPESMPWQGSRSGVCLYTLGIGNRLSRTRLETVDSCGYSVAANKVAQPRDMTHFVQSVLYKGPADTDGDGIYDYRDRCPDTSAGRIVDFSGCLRFVTSEGGNFK
ncbi:MAG: VWA domain-containing protein [Gammaproteobacteria bacterium]|nr:VWA domain-containing protein [Gammaproteobacteria bacterium]